MDMMVQFKQEQTLGTMDTSSTSLPLEMMPSFLATAPQDSIHPQPDMAYILDQVKSEIHANSVSQRMHIPIAAQLSMPPFLDSPMEAIDVPPQQPLLSSAGYVPVDPFTFVGHPDKVDLTPDGSLLSIGTTQDPGIASAMLSNNSSFAPSLEAALDSSPVADGRSRVNTSLSPQSIHSNFSSLSPPRQQPTPTVDYPSTASNSSVDESDSQSPPRAVIGKLLKE